MNIQALVVASDPCERAMLSQLLRPADGDKITVRLRFVGSVAEARQADRLGLDMALVAASPGILSDASACLTLGGLCGGLPVVIVTAELPPGRTWGEWPAGVIDEVLNLHGTREMALQLLARVALADNDQKQALRQISGDIVLASMADAVVITDAAGDVCYCNTAAYQLTASAGITVLGRAVDRLMTLQDPKTLKPIEHPVFRVLATKQSLRLPPGAILVRADGSEIAIEDSTSPIIRADGSIAGTVMVFHDITAAKELQAQVDYLARHDYLTGLPNRYAAQLYLRNMLNEAHERKAPLAVMYLDLDNFKAINDTLGHAEGDQLLVSVAERLRACLRTNDVVSRQGGDEFLVLMAPGTNDEDAIAAAQRILEAVALPHTVGKEEVHVGCSVGLALYPVHGASDESLLQHADTALHAAKAGGRNTYRIFNDDMLTAAVKRRMLEGALRHTLHRGGFELFYQPKVTIRDGLVSGCEALLRWRHPEWGWVSPAQFVHCAEQTGQIVGLGRWVLRQALRQLRSWQDSGHAPGPVAINVSALELRQADFIEHVEASLASFGVAPALLQIELTESALMRDVAGAADTLGRLKALGMSVAVDDFGTGYSSLSYLADLPIDLLKIDRAFVHGITRATPRRQALLLAVLAVGDKLSLPVVAEGIETSDEAGFLMDAGCTLGQGYFYSPALDCGAFEQFLSRDCSAARLGALLPGAQ